MNRGELIALAKDYVDERGDFWKTATLQRFANQANRIVFNRLAYLDTGSVQTIGRITYPANTENVELKGASYLNKSGGILRVVGVGTLSSDAQISGVNRFRALSPLSRGDDEAYSTNVNDPSLYTMESHGPRWRFHNEQLYLVPPVGTATVLRITYMPNPTAFASDSSNLLDGLALRYHDLVVSVMVTLMQSKERGAAGSEATRAATALIDQELSLATVGESAGLILEYSSPY